MGVGAGLAIAALGSQMGGGGGDNRPKRMQVQLSRDLYENASPLIDELTRRSMSFMDGGMDVRSTPAYADLQRSAGENYNQAKDNLIARFGRGGAMQDAFGDLEANRAGMMTAGTADIYKDENDRAFQLMNSLLGGTTTNLTSASQAQAQKLAAAAAEDSAEKESLGSAAALGASMYMGGK